MLSPSASCLSWVEMRGSGVGVGQGQANSKEQRLAASRGGEGGYLSLTLLAPSWGHPSGAKPLGLVSHTLGLGQA